MKNLLQNLLILFALGLCAMIAFQWHREAQLHESLHRLAAAQLNAQALLQALRADVNRAEAEAAQLRQWGEAAQTNAADLTRLRAELARAGAEHQQLTNQLEDYKQALDTANENIKRQNENVARQNDELRKLADERNEVVRKFNALAEEHNDLAARWNALRERQGGGAASGNP